MKKILLASAGVMVMSAGTGYAACIPTPSCSSLGYESSSSCEGGIKCPFGNAWNCTLVNKITEIEKIIQEGGASGSKGDTSNCKIGSIFYSDWTCSSGSLSQGKTPIGVVVYTNGEGHGQIMALKPIGGYQWSGEYVDLSLNNFTTYQAASTDYQSCTNTMIIMTAGDKITYPAAWATKEYSTTGTKAGDWCLPAGGIMTSIKNNMSVINAGFILTGGTQIGTSSYYWSSSEDSRYYAWASNFSSDYGLYLNLDNYYNDYNKKDSREVRPVLEF